MSTPRQALRDRLAGRIDTVGRPLAYRSVCLLCGLDSGPWLTRHSADLSGLLHLNGHHGDVEAYARGHRIGYGEGFVDGGMTDA